MSYMYAYTRLPRHWLLHLHASNCHVIRVTFIIPIYLIACVYIVADYESFIAAKREGKISSAKL